MSRRWNDLPTVETMIALPKAELDALREELERVTRDNMRMHLLYEVVPPERDVLAENERLREALERIAEMWPSEDATAAEDWRTQRNIARAALEPTPDLD